MMNNNYYDCNYIYYRERYISEAYITTAQIMHEREVISKQKIKSYLQKAYEWSFLLTGHHSSETIIVGMIDFQSRESSIILAPSTPILFQLNSQLTSCRHRIFFPTNHLFC